MASFNTLKQYGFRYALGSALRKTGYDLEYFSGRSKLKPFPSKVYNITVDDVTMKLDFGNIPISKPIWQRIKGVREPETTAIIRTLLRPGDRVLELGSCYGYFSLLISASVGSTGSVLGVEGLPEYFKILTRNVERNQPNNIELINAFVGSQQTSIDFELGVSSPYESINLYNAGKTLDNSVRKVTVPCINLHDFLVEKNYQPTHIFMDIEGFEVEAIEQLSEEYLLRHNPVIVFEHHEKFYDDGKGLDYLRSLLGTCGYTTRRVYGNIIALKS